MPRRGSGGRRMHASTPQHPCASTKKNCTCIPPTAVHCVGQHNACTTLPPRLYPQAKQFASVTPKPLIPDTPSIHVHGACTATDRSCDSGMLGSADHTCGVQLYWPTCNPCYRLSLHCGDLVTTPPAPAEPHPCPAPPGACPTPSPDPTPLPPRPPRPLPGCCGAPHFLLLPPSRFARGW